MPLKEYYDRRAPEYEAIYEREDPVRQLEQSQLSAVLREALAGRRALEVACGTGYWTRIAAQTARSILAIDVAPAMLAHACARAGPNTSFRLGDAYALDALPGDFDAGFATFWLSHVPRASITEFLEAFHRRIGPEAPVVLADNVFVPGLGGALVCPPGSADSFKLRLLADGSTHEVLKNYFDRAELARILEPRAQALEIHVGTCFWWARYQTPHT